MIHTEPSTLGGAAPRVLLISPNRIGEHVIASGLWDEIGRRWPGARVTVVASGPTAPFFRSAPGIERTIVMDKRPMAGHWLRLWRGLAGGRYDAVIDPRGSLTAWVVRAKERRIYRRALETGRPKVEVMGALMGLDHALEPRLYIDDRARLEAEAVLAPQLAAGPGPGPVLALAPLAVQPGKSWPAERWGELVARLKEDARFRGWRFMPVGGPGDRAAAAPALAAAGERAIDFVGRGDILASAEAIRRSALFVGNDSGLMHVAAAAGAPTLGLFGPTEWWLYGPRGPRTAILSANTERGQFQPIEALSVDQVVDAVAALRDRYPPKTGARP